MQEGCAALGGGKASQHAQLPTARQMTDCLVKHGNDVLIRKKKTSINVRDQQLVNLYIGKQITMSFDCSSSQQRLLTLADTYSRHTACNSLASAKQNHVFL